MTKVTQFKDSQSSFDEKKEKGVNMKKQCIICDIDLLPIPEFEDYLLSKDGEIFSRNHRNVKGKRGTGEIKKLNPYINKHGYLSIHLYRNGERHRFGVHYLVCTTFHGERPEGLVVSHLNHDQKDNRPENLTWETQKENIRRKIAIGHGVGSKNPSAKFNPEQIRQIRLLRNLGEKTRTLATKFGCHRMTISHICNMKRYLYE